MMSSDEEPQDGSQDEQDMDDDGRSGHETMSLANFLFGNVDEKGELENDFFDEDARKQLGRLERLPVGRDLIENIVSSDDVSKGTNGQESSAEGPNSGDEKDDSDDYDQKSPSAVDFSDINELAEEVPEEEAKFRQALSALQFKMPTAPAKQAKKRPVDDDDDYDTPSKVAKENSVDDSDKATPVTKEKPKLSLVIPPANSDSDSSLSTPSLDTPSKRLGTPLANMLPPKYSNTDVQELFPEFRQDKVLRFSRLFGPGKQSHIPQPWKNVKNKRKKSRTGDGDKFSPEKRPTDDQSAKDQADQSGQSEDEEKDREGSQKPTEESKAAGDGQDVLGSVVKEFELDEGESASDSEVATDDEDRMLNSSSLRNYDKEDADKNDDSPLKIADWRYGPAQYWYDFIGVPESGDTFDYGLKVATESELQNKYAKYEVDPDPDEAFHLVTQLQWEDDVIWNGDEIKSKVLAKLSDKNHAAGWVPSGLNRTASAFTQQVKGAPTTPKQPVAPPAPTTTKGSKAERLKAEAAAPEKDETWYSIFPVENEELVYGSWEDDIIWDAEAVKKIPEPRILTLDPNDENIVLGIPDDIDPATLDKKPPPPIPLKEKKEHHLKKSRILLGKAGVIAEPEPEAPPQQQIIAKDPFNISNDEYYNPKMTTDTALKPNVGGNLIQHSIPALELRQPFFPTHVGLLKLRSHHRPPLRRFTHGTIANALPHSVYPLIKHMKKKAKQREQERLASGGGEMFFMRTPEDLSGKDGELILAEFSEEHPPLISQVGMATKIKNYYKRKPGKDAGPPNYKFGEIAISHTTPFLGNLPPGQSLQTFENNLFRAPVYEHDVPPSDFLIIRTRNNYHIREVKTIYTIGQELPLFEVPGPNSKKANNFIRDFLQVFIYRLFWKSQDTPKRIKMEDIKKAFPSHSESSIRKRLKLCADFKRTGMDSNWWVLKPDFRLPTEEEMRALVSPEQCCAYYAMIAAEQRLKDAGYGEKSLFAAEDENDEEMQLKMDDEVKAAPWNTTRAFIAAMKGKCLLALHGVADPTGCGEGFSYVRIPNKPQISKEEQKEAEKEKKTVTGTDADLRRLPLNQAKNLLRKFKVPEEEIKKLSRWEVIDVVRTLSTAQAKAGSDAMSKFARGNRFSIAEHQERYKEECQRMFDLQNRILASHEELSTDEGTSDEEDSEIEEMGKNIESMLSNKKTSQQVTYEKEEAERRELQKLIMGEDSNQGDDKKKKRQDEDDDSVSVSSSAARILKIYRTYKSSDGKEFVRIETVRKPAIIDTYVRIRTTKDADFIRKFATALDEQQKEEKRREKRRLQEQLRRLKRNEEKDKFMRRIAGEPLNTPHDTSSRSYFDFNADSPYKESTQDLSSPLSASLNETVELTPTGRKKKTPKEKKQKKEKEKLDNVRYKCGACGGTGHMRTNRVCPKWTGDGVPQASVSVAMTIEEENEENRNLLAEDELVKVDETKLVLSKKLLSHMEETRRKALVIKVPKDALKRRRRTGTVEHCDYLQKPGYKASNRRRTDPLVTLSTFFDEILAEIKEMEGTTLFWQPVNPKQVPDYYNIITDPIDIQTMRKKARDKKYQSREQFITDVKLMVDNSVKYNGYNNVLTDVARRMYDLAERRLIEKEEKLTRLEKAINPLLDDNDQVAFSFIIQQIITKLKSLPESWPFHKPVDKKKIKTYYDVIKDPMDLETMAKNASMHKYSSREQFLADVELIHNNSLNFNGAESPITKTAEQMLEIARQECSESNPESNPYGQQLAALEVSIEATREAALDDADNESVITGGDDGFSRPPSSAAPSLPDDSYMDFDENSQSGIQNRTEQDLSITPEPDEESDDETRRLLPVPGSALQPQGQQVPMETAPEDEIVDENYDPEEFLLQRFNNPQAAQGTASPAYEDHFQPPDSVAPPHPVYHVMPSVRQPDDDTPGDIWF